MAHPIIGHVSQITLTYANGKTRLQPVWLPIDDRDTVDNILHDWLVKANKAYNEDSWISCYVVNLNKPAWMDEKSA